MRVISKLSVSACVILAACSASRAAVTVGVSPTLPYIGYMNVFELAANGGGYVFGSVWGVADLNASFTGDIGTLTPNTSISRDVPLTDAFWWTADGQGNKNMFASFYVEDNAIAGELVTFTGTILTNTLVEPYTTNIFIKDFAADYSSHTETVIPAAVGTFSISLQTSADGHHIQYGFETVGPNARLDQVASLGSVTIGAAVTAVPGDYNNDGIVDAADYTVWADNFGQSGVGVIGDGNGDNIVDAADYTVWADHFGQGTPPGGAVPEPAAAGLLAAALPLLSRRRR